jgi:hypothetical protein
MPPAVKKSAVGAGVPVAERADAPGTKDVEPSGKEKAPKEARVPKQGAEKKEKKEVKDKAAGCAKLTAFFTMKPASAAPTTPAATPKEKVADDGKTPAKRVDECILLDSDSEGAANIGSNTPPTATKKSDAAKKDCAHLANAMQVKKAAEGAKGAEAASSAGASSSAAGANETNAAKAADGKAKAEAKKKAARPAKTDNKDAKAKDEVAKGRQGTLCFQPGLCNSQRVSRHSRARACPMHACPHFRTQLTWSCCAVGEGSSRQTTLDIGGKTGASSIKGAFSRYTIGLF